MLYLVCEAQEDYRCRLFTCWIWWLLKGKNYHTVTARENDLMGKLLVCLIHSGQSCKIEWQQPPCCFWFIKNTAGSDIIGQNLTSFIFWSARKNKSYSRRYLHELWTVWDKYTNISFCLFVHCSPNECAV